jgi:zinc protease
MKNNFLISSVVTSILVSVFIWTGCSSSPKRGVSQSFSEGVRLPEHREIELSNGLKVLFIRDSSLPRINIMALVGSGATRDEIKKSGQSYLTASLLDEGTEKHSSAEMAEHLEGLGADLSIQPGYDFTYLSIKGLSYTREALLDSFLEILLTPKFDTNELERLRRQVQGALTKMEDDPEQYADRLFSKALFGGHPYALPSMGDVESIQRISRQDVLNFYKSNYIPRNTTLAVVGDFDDLFFNQVKTKFSTWMSDVTESSLVRTPPDYKQPKVNIFLKGKKGLVQTQLRLGHVFIDRSHPEFLSLRAANMALGGAFASRLNQRVRDDLGLTYSISSSFDARRYSGPFMIETFTRNDKVGETLGAALNVYKEFVEKGMTEEELQASKSVLIGQFPRAVETMDSLAYQMLALRYFGIEDSYLTQFVTNVKALKLDTVNANIKKYFHPDQLDIVVYGDGAVIEPQLKKFGSVQKL